MGKKKVILDTNIYVSALGYAGSERQVFRQCLNGDLILFLTDEILKEINRVVEYPKFNFSTAQKDALKLVLGEKGNIIPAPFKLFLLKDDPTDNKFIDAAIAAEADYLITGDKHLLKLMRVGETKIIKASQFLSEQ